MLEIKELHVSAEGKEILKGINLSVKSGEIHALMGPNGSGKSTLALALMGHPKYQITQGKVLFYGIDMLKLPPDERAKKGLFLAFQYPYEIQGLTLNNFLFQLYKIKNPDASMFAFRKIITDHLKQLKIDEEFLSRELNVGLSGGEKKRVEALQLLLTQPQLAILDETDSGLDVDSLKVVANAIERLKSPRFSAIIITHYKRIFNHLKPDFVHVMNEGKIILTGTAKLVDELESKGYTFVKNHE